MKVIFAYNPDTDEPLYHGPTRNSKMRINFLDSKFLLLSRYFF